MPHAVLFICVHNAARSQMAEAFLREHGGKSFAAESAGLEPGTMNPRVVMVMKELGFDLSRKMTRGVSDVYHSGKKYDAVITVCDAASTERCPVFPGNVKREAWSFADPASFSGDPAEVLEKTRRVRDAIEEAVKDYIVRTAYNNYWI